MEQSNITWIDYGEVPYQGSDRMLWWEIDGDDTDDNREPGQGYYNWDA